MERFPADRVGLVLVAHMLPPLVPFVEAVGRVIDIRCAIGIPYSTLPGVYREVAARVPTLLPDELGELAAVAGDQTVAGLREEALPVVLCEVGGYCASTLSRIAPSGDRVLGVVEHTIQGHWRYAEHPALPCHDEPRVVRVGDGPAHGLELRDVCPIVGVDERGRAGLELRLDGRLPVRVQGFPFVVRELARSEDLCCRVG